MFQSSDHNACEPLTKLMLEIVKTRCYQKKWKRVKIISKHVCGMMLHSCVVEQANGTSEILQLPIEYCDRMKQVRDRIEEKNGKSYSTITFEIISNGSYEINMI